MAVAELLAILRGGDAAAFGGIVEETGFEQDAGNAKVAQDLEARVAHAAIVGSRVGEDGGVDGGGESDVVVVLGVACIRIGFAVVGLVTLRRRWRRWRARPAERDGSFRRRCRRCPALK